jgi:hypothetical protein
MRSVEAKHCLTSEATWRAADGELDQWYEMNMRKRRQLCLGAFPGCKHLQIGPIRSRKLTYLTGI